MTGVRLTDPATQNPYLNSATIAGSYGVYGSSAAAWTVRNLGTIQGSVSYGVSLVAGGSVINGSPANQSAGITGYDHGVMISGAAGSVVNEGLIAATSTAAGDTAAVELAAGGKVVNHGRISSLSDGVRFDVGGSLTNGDSAGSHALIQGGFAGVAVYGAAGSITNAGAILGGQIGLNLASGGLLVNGASGNATATISGAGGVWVYGQSGTLTNFGTITCTLNDGVFLTAGGSVSNQAGAEIAGYNNGVRILSHPGTVFNAGTITGAGLWGVYLARGGSVDNAAGGSIIATSGASGAIDILSRTASVTNAGTLVGAVVMGTTHKPEATATLVNSGTIEGDVRIYGTTARVVVLPGAVFTGHVATFNGGANTLELAAGAARGTLSGLGATFAGFGQVMVDAKSQWNLTGANALPATGVLNVAAHAALRTLGSLSIGGVVDDGSITARGGSIAIAGTLSGAGVLALGSGASVDLGGAGAGVRLAFLAGTAAETLSLGTASSVGNAITGFGASDTIDLLGVVASAPTFSTGGLTLATTTGSLTLAVQGPYVSGNFALTSDHHGGTDITYVPVPAAAMDLARGAPAWSGAAGLGLTGWSDHPAMPVHETWR